MPAGTASERAGAGRVVDAADVWAMVVGGDVGRDVGDVFAGIFGGVFGGDVAVWATGSVTLPAFDFTAVELATGGF